MTKRPEAFKRLQKVARRFPKTRIATGKSCCEWEVLKPHRVTIRVKGRLGQKSLGQKIAPHPFIHEDLGVLAKVS